MSEAAITRYDAMRQAIVEARDIDDLKDIRDKAEALRQYAKQAGESLENQNMIAEIKIRAQRRMGEISLELPTAQGTRTDLTSSQGAKKLKGDILREAGISKDEASRSEAIAAIPESLFESHIAITKATANKELTSSGILKVAKKEKQKQAKERRQEELKAAPIIPNKPKPFLYVARAESTPIDDAIVDVVITSPPYNLGDDNWPMGGDGREARDGIEYSSHGDAMEQAEYEAWQVLVLRELWRVAKPGASLFYNHKVRTSDGVMIHPMQWLLSPGNPWTLRQELIWNRKSTHNHSATLFWPIDERIYWMTKGRPTLRSESIGLPTIWEEFGPIPNTWHPAPFTDKLPRMLLQAVGAEPGMVALDPFAGSCTTLKVALEMGCEAIGVDISREYLEQACMENGWIGGIIN